MNATTTAPAVTSKTRVLDVFRDLAQATVAEIVAATGLSRTTVSTNLRTLAEDGDTIRMDIDGGTVWALTPSRKAAFKRAAAKLAKAAAAAKANAAPSTTKGRKTVTTSNETSDNNNAARTPTGRRAKGVIDGEIITFFGEHPDETFGSYAVANAIGSSKGAAYVALNRMTRDGVTKLVSEGPDRYQLA